jgi:hypothetical protein|nr:MAG TPA: hypothetical protein [Caudoviricetes sp.]
MPQLIDLTNKTFGKLTVLNTFERRNKYIYWLCRCECGKQKYIRSDHIRYKKIKSCGCFEEEARRKGNNKSHNLSKTRLFKIFQGMKKRCYNERNNAYKNYGGRGISICPEWLNDFVSFYNWALSHGYADNLSIDRIDVDGNYEPSNCRWVDAKTQANNRRNTKNKEKHNEN